MEQLFQDKTGISFSNLIRITEHGGLVAQDGYQNYHDKDNNIYTWSCWTNEWVIMDENYKDRLRKLIKTS